MQPGRASRRFFDVVIQHRGIGYEQDAPLAHPAICNQSAGRYRALCVGSHSTCLEPAGEIYGKFNPVFGYRADPGSLVLVEQQVEPPVVQDRRDHDHVVWAARITQGKIAVLGQHRIGKDQRLPSFAQPGVEGDILRRCERARLGEHDALQPVERIFFQGI